MKPTLLDTLVSKNIITAGSTIEANYLARHIDGNCSSKTHDFFIMTNASYNDKKVKHLHLKRKTDGLEIKATVNDILSVDGMDPNRLARIFNINPDGSIRKVKLDEFGNPVKRGRKPKKKNDLF